MEPDSQRSLIEVIANLLSTVVLPAGIPAALLILDALLLAFFAIGEAALSGLSRARYEHLLDRARSNGSNGGNSSASGASANPADGYNFSPQVLQSLQPLVERAERLGETLAIGKTLSLALGASLSLWLMNIIFGIDSLFAALVLALGALLIVHTLPMPLTLGRSEEIALALRWPILAFGLVLWPFTLISRFVRRLVFALIGRTVPTDGVVGSAEELSEIIGERIVEEDEREMIDAIFDLEQTSAREIMVPRMDVTALPADTPVDKALEIIIDQGFSRLPVYGESIDEIIGMLYVKDLLPLVLSGNFRGTVRELVRQAYFIPESKKTGELLHELQSRKIHIAVVVDEYGGTAGIVTIEDLLEEIVGEIQDEFDDAEEDKIVEGKEGEAVFKATVSIDDVNDTLGVHLEGEEVDTIGGLVYERLGRVPLVGDKVEADGAIVTVLSTVGRRIKKVKVIRRQASDGTGGGSPDESSLGQMPQTGPTPHESPERESRITVNLVKSRSGRWPTGHRSRETMTRPRTPSI